MRAPSLPPKAAALDFAALELLRVVHDSGSFSAAAERLGVNQSAVSYTMAKLRGCFGDPLFVRQGGQQVATERCQDLLERSGLILAMLEDMASPEAFDPPGSTRNVAIACNYYERVLLIPRIVAAIRQAAPRMTVTVINALGDGHQRLLSREADVLVGPFAPSGAGFHSRRLYVEEYACLMDPAHPAAHGPDLDVDRYLALNHVLIQYGPAWRSAYLQEIDAAGQVLTPAITVPSPAGMDTLIAGSDLVATVPRRLGARNAARLVLRDCPFRGQFDLRLGWAAHTNASSMHCWLRDLIWQVGRG